MNNLIILESWYLHEHARGRAASCINCKFSRLINVKSNIYLKIDAVILKGGWEQTFIKMADKCLKGTNGSSGLFRIHRE